MKQQTFHSDYRVVLAAGAALLAAVGLAGPSAVQAADGYTWELMPTPTTENLGHHASGGRTIDVWDSSYAIVAGGRGSDNVVLRWDGKEWSNWESATDHAVSAGGSLDRSGVVINGPTGEGNDVMIGNYGNGNSNNRRVHVHTENGQWEDTHAYDLDGPLFETNLRKRGMHRVGSRVFSAHNWGVAYWDEGDDIVTGWNDVALSDGSQLPTDSLDFIANGDEDNVFISDGSNYLWHSTDGGETVSEIAGFDDLDGVSVRSMYATGPNSLWTVGSNGEIHHWDGSGFTEHNSGTSEWLSDIYAIDDENVWAVGLNGTALFYDGVSWELIDLSHLNMPGESLYQITADENGHLYVTGANGTILHAIPEPGSLALLGMGGLLVLRRRRG